MTEHIRLTGTVLPSMSGKRLDAALALLFTEYSRTRLQQWILEGYVTVEQEVNKNTRYKVRGDEQIIVVASWPDPTHWQAQSLPVEVVYADDTLIVVNKPTSVVVHPAVGNTAGTLVNALLHHFPEVAILPRAGIVHRLDKNTSGLLVIARTLAAHTSLVAQLQAHEVKREYEAIVNGVLTSGGTISTQMGRHPVDRKRMAVVKAGKEAITHYRIIKRFAKHTHIKVELETGRTHQIRVHLSHLGFPLVGDKTYGYRPLFPPHCSAELREALAQRNHQALHARRLGLVHPVTKEQMSWEAVLPDDFMQLLNLLNADGES